MIKNFIYATFPVLQALFHMVLATAFVSPILWYCWNIAIVHFVNFATPISFWDAVCVLFMIQVIPFWTVRRVEIKYIPVSEKLFAAAQEDEDV